MSQIHNSTQFHWREIVLFRRNICTDSIDDSAVSEDIYVYYLHPMSPDSLSSSKFIHFFRNFNGGKDLNQIFSFLHKFEQMFTPNENTNSCVWIFAILIAMNQLIQWSELIIISSLLHRYARWKEFYERMPMPWFENTLSVEKVALFIVGKNVSRYKKSRQYYKNRQKF